MTCLRGMMHLCDAFSLQEPCNEVLTIGDAQFGKNPSMNAQPSKKHLDQVRDYLLRQNPNRKGPILIPRELIEAAERGELPEAPEAQQTPHPKEVPETLTKVGQDSENTCSTKRVKGRPAHFPPWLEAAAQLVANGLTLRKALWRLGVSIPENQLRQVYRWTLFRKYCEEAKGKFVAEWGTTPPRKAESITTSILGQWEEAQRIRKEVLR